MALPQGNGKVLDLHGMSRLRQTIDGELAAWNTVAQHEAFTVTGVVEVFSIIDVTETVASAGAAEISFGREGDTDAYAAAQVVTGLTAGQLVNPGGTVITARGLDAYQAAGAALPIHHVIADLDIGYEVTVAALNNGLIDWYLWWRPLSDDGRVVLGTGAAF